MRDLKFYVGLTAILYFAEPAAGGDGGGTGAPTGGGGSPAAPSGGMSAADIAADGGDIKFLETDAPAADSKPAEGDKPADKSADQKAEPEEINLSLLEEGQPEWLAKVTDEAAKTEIGKLLDLQKAFTEKFKDAADLAAFFKDLPGGREQVTALQTLSKEVGEIDGFIAENTPESNGKVVERYLGEAPDGGIGLFKAGAAHLAQKNPEAWNQIGKDLINGSLKAAGIGAGFDDIISAIGDMRKALQGDGDGEAFGRAASKLLGAPQADARPDPNVEKAKAEAERARSEGVKAQTESWEFRNEKSTEKIDNHFATETGKLLAKVLPASISEKDRTSLRNDIASEIMSQLTADAWLSSKVVELIGFKTGKQGAWQYGKTNLKASQEDWNKATELVVNAATPKLIAKAVSKIVSQWSRDRAASNKEARDKARSATQTKDAGAGKTVGQGSAKKPLTAEQLANMSDEEFLNY